MTQSVYKPKRGTLAPLMLEEEKEKAGIHELSYDFGCRITRLNLLHDNGYLDDKQFDSLKHDMDRILKILTSIVKTMNQKVKGIKESH